MYKVNIQKPSDFPDMSNEQLKLRIKANKNYNYTIKPHLGINIVMYISDICVEDHKTDERNQRQSK